MTRPRRRRRGRWVLAAAVVVALLLYFGAPLYLPAAARFLDVSEKPRPADCALILGGGPASRPFGAAALYRAGLVRRVLVPMVKPSPGTLDGLGDREHVTTMKVLRHRGVPEEAIELLPLEVNSTEDEARGLAHYLDEHPGTTVAVVTSCYHTRRTRTLFRRVLGSRAADLQMVGVPTDGFDTNDWWRSEEGCRCYALEYAKTVFYLFRR